MTTHCLETPSDFTAAIVNMGSYTNLFSGFFSTIGTFIIVVHYYRYHRKVLADVESGIKELYMCIFSLAISGFFASITIFSSALWAFLDRNGNGQHFKVCEGFSIVIQTFVISSTVWINSIGIFLYKFVCGDPLREQPFKICSIICWGFSFMFFVLYAFLPHTIELNSAKLFCIPSQNFEIFITIVVSVSVVMNIGLYILTKRKILVTQHIKIHQTAKALFQRKQAEILRNYLLGFIVCWFSYMAGSVASFFHCNLWFLWIFNVIFPPLMGFVEFVVYTYAIRNYRQPLDKDSLDYPLLNNK